MRDFVAALEPGVTSAEVTWCAARGVDGVSWIESMRYLVPVSVELHEVGEGKDLPAPVGLD